MNSSQIQFSNRTEINNASSINSSNSSLSESNLEFQIPNSRIDQLFQYSGLENYQKNFIKTQIQKIIRNQDYIFIQKKDQQEINAEFMKRYHQEIQTHIQQTKDEQNMQLQIEKHQFLLIDKVGQGSFGQVIRILDLNNTKNLYAIQIYQNEQHKIQQQQNYQQIKELKIQENIMKFIEDDDNRFSEFQKSIYCSVMYAGESTLDKVIANQQQWTTDEILCLYNSLYEIIKKFAEKSVYHNDIKPSNIVFTKVGAIQFIDIGSIQFEFMKYSASIGATPQYSIFQGSKKIQNLKNWLKTQAGEMEQKIGILCEIYSFFVILQQDINIIIHDKYNQEKIDIKLIFSDFQRQMKQLLFQEKQYSQLLEQFEVFNLNLQNFRLVKIKNLSDKYLYLNWQFECEKSIEFNKKYQQIEIDRTIQNIQYHLQEQNLENHHCLYYNLQQLEQFYVNNDYIDYNSFSIDKIRFQQCLKIIIESFNRRTFDHIDFQMIKQFINYLMYLQYLKEDEIKDLKFFQIRNKNLISQNFTKFCGLDGYQYLKNNKFWFLNTKFYNQEFETLQRRQFLQLHFLQQNFLPHTDDYLNRYLILSLYYGDSSLNMNLNMSYYLKQFQEFIDFDYLHKHINKFNFLQFIIFQQYREKVKYQYQDNLFNINQNQNYDNFVENSENHNIQYIQKKNIIIRSHIVFQIFEDLNLIDYRFQSILKNNQQCLQVANFKELKFEYEKQLNLQFRDLQINSQICQKQLRVEELIKKNFYKDSEQLCLQIFQIINLNFIPTQQMIIQSLSRLAGIQSCQWNFREPEQLLIETIILAEQIQDKSILSYCLSNYAHNLLFQMKLEQMREIQYRNLKIQNQNKQIQKNIIIKTYLNLSLSYQSGPIDSIESLEKAEIYVRKMLDLQRQWNTNELNFEKAKGFLGYILLKKIEYLPHISQYLEQGYYLIQDSQDSLQQRLSVNSSEIFIPIIQLERILLLKQRKFHDVERQLRDMLLFQVIGGKNNVDFLETVKLGFLIFNLYHQQKFQECFQNYLQLYDKLKIIFKNQSRICGGILEFEEHHQNIDNFFQFLPLIVSLQQQSEDIKQNVLKPTIKKLYINRQLQPHELRIFSFKNDKLNQILNDVNEDTNKLELAFGYFVWYIKLYTIAQNIFHENYFEIYE